MLIYFTSRVYNIHQSTPHVTYKHMQECMALNICQFTSHHSGPIMSFTPKPQSRAYAYCGIGTSFNSSSAKPEIVHSTVSFEYVNEDI